MVKNSQQNCGETHAEHTHNNTHIIIHIRLEFDMCVFMSFKGTVRRFLENHGNSIEAVVFAVSDTEEVCMAAVCFRFPQPFSYNSPLELFDISFEWSQSKEG